MSEQKRMWFQAYLPQILAATMVLGLYGFARPPAKDEAARAAMASRFGFERHELPSVAGPPPRSLRPVNPSLKHIQGWISAVGGAVALHDLDSDGLPNDVCYVETRTDQVIVAPVPGTPSRYAPFTLDASPLPWDGATMAPMGCLPRDLNEDGWADVVVYYWGRTPVAFLQKPGMPGQSVALGADAFTRQEVNPVVERWYSNAATFADVDGDGHPDFIITNYFPDGSHIIDENAPVPDGMQDSMTRAFNGGRNRWLRWTGATSGAAPSVTFQEMRSVLEDPALEEQIEHGWTLAVGAADLDGDLLPEVYFANDFGPDRMLHNRSERGRFRFASLSGEKGLATPNSKVLGRDSFKGMGVDFGDVNGDGLLDLYVSNISAEYSLLESHFLWESTGEVARMKDGVAPYVDRSEPRGVARSGWGWEARLADFDNDGVLEALQATGFLKGNRNSWPELQELATGNDQMLSLPESWPRFQGGDDLSGHQHNPFWVQDSSGRFHDLAPELGIATPEVTRGIATADVDGDGALDFAVGNQWEPSFAYRNRAASPGAFLGLRLLHPVAGTPASPLRVEAGRAPYGGKGTPALGASVKVRLPGGRHLVGQVDGGNGHSGKRSPELHFGLGRQDASAKLNVEVAWRDGTGRPHHQSLNLTLGWHTIVLGDEGVTEASR
ncbi:CRTAC1 family protein [Pyxidicoccus sp. MSG2]|uniref:CRTAC1 family protein n=1 Tax=Pyxidicoccus sp. MSG2 TaxID=2996790 RepID=UPI00226FB15F|nr:CRTAC1 family protein [Pyxidicoccus sp. MSG2]MCY1021110.1 CRTAC1 family protein [Pyxidicoccus sp. MSG2]